MAMNPGEQIRLLSRPEWVGVIIQGPHMVAGENWYTINFGPGRTSRHPEADIELYHGSSENVCDLLLSSRFGSREAFSKLLTYLKLSISLRSQIYAVAASRTIFHAYQFKPLLKFLESRNHRLLIADEVGLGKTIEAGLILTEMRKRRPLKRVLVVPPAHLVPKWRDEMRRRFDFDFEKRPGSGLNR